MLGIAFVLLIILYAIQTWRVAKWKWEYERCEKDYLQLEKITNSNAEEKVG